MNIQFFTELKDNPIEFGGEMNFANRGIPLSEIEQLEQDWNNGLPFPKALRELLFLAGDFCYVLDTGLMESQQEMQEEARLWMTEEGQVRVISRPFYVLEVRNEEQFVMVYLDEGDNPNIHSVYLDHDSEQYLGSGIGWNYDIGKTLKDFIKVRIDKVKQGRNPF